MPASRSRLRRSFVLLPLLAGLAAPGIPPPTQAAPTSTAGTIPSPPTTAEQKSLLVQMQDAFTNIAQTVEPTVVNIKAERLRGADGADGGDSPAPAPRAGGGESHQAAPACRSPCRAGPKRLGPASSCARTATS